MAFLTLGINLAVEKRRAISALVFGAIGLVIGLLFQAQVGTGTKYENFLLVITYWITPYLAVVITDYLLNRGRYPESIFYDRKHQTWNGFIAMLAGIIATIPFWDQGDPMPLGWVPKNYPQFGDLSFFAGGIVAVVVYLVLRQVNRGSQVSRRSV
jgi:NCS1 family nucleobase:cation symporter-1